MSITILTLKIHKFMHRRCKIAIENVINQTIAPRWGATYFSIFFIVM